MSTGEVGWIRSAIEVTMPVMVDQICAVFKVPASSFSLSGAAGAAVSESGKEIVAAAMESMRRKVLADINDRVACTCYRGHRHGTFEGRVFCDAMSGRPL